MTITRMRLYPHTLVMLIAHTDHISEKKVTSGDIHVDSVKAVHVCLLLHYFWKTRVRNARFLHKQMRSVCMHNKVHH